MESTLCYVYFSIENNSHGKKTRTAEIRSRASTGLKSLLIFSDMRYSPLFISAHCMPHHSSLSLCLCSPRVIDPHQFLPESSMEHDISWRKKYILIFFFMHIRLGPLGGFTIHITRLIYTHKYLQYQVKQSNIDINILVIREIYTTCYLNLMH